MNQTEDKLARILYTENPARQPWDGDSFSYSEAKSRNEHEYRLAHRQAKALMAEIESVDFRKES